jgi:streptomycin 6-kinase
MEFNALPEDFRRTIEMFGERGAVWLDRLPALVAAYERRWDLRVLPPFALSYNYVAPAVRADGTQVVLKLGVPDPELSSEIEALRFFEGRGAVRLLEAEPGEGVLLLERLSPGVPLERMEDDVRATSIAGQVMRQLWRPVQQEKGLLSLEKWTAGLRRLRAQFEGGSGPFPEALVSRAEGLIAELLASSDERTLMHGDLHYWNILSAQRQEWLAIDPKGVVGDPAFEPSAWLLNTKPAELYGSELKRQLRRRVDQFSEELGLERARVLGWGCARAVLSSWWSYEDHGCGGEHALEVAASLVE